MVDWKAKFFQGWFVGPNETEIAFTERSQQSQNKSPIRWKGISVESMEITYQNDGLWPWEGACCWIDTHLVRIQLRKPFQHRDRWFGYSREELLVHEAIHALRAQFNEPRFEEHLAYQASSSSFRRRWGPLFRSSKESGGFLLICCITAWFWNWLWPLFFGITGCLILRLLIEQRILNKTKQKITEIHTQSDLLLIALTDREVLDFSTCSVTEIRHYMETEPSPRWVQLRSVFFSS